MPLKPIQYPMVNGVRQSFASCQLQIVGADPGAIFEPKGWSSFNFSRTRERGEVRGPHPDPLAKTRGENKYEASLTMYLAEWNYLVREILGGPGYGDQFFRIVLQYLENGMDVVKVECKGCTMDKSGIDNSQGADATQVEIDLHPVKILWNDEDDVDNPLAV